MRQKMKSAFTNRAVIYLFVAWDQFAEHIKTFAVAGTSYSSASTPEQHKHMDKLFDGSGSDICKKILKGDKIFSQSFIEQRCIMSLSKFLQWYFHCIDCSFLKMSIYHESFRHNNELPLVIHFLQNSRSCCLWVFVE